MNLNNTSFNQVPIADIRRSRFERNNTLLTTFDAGKLVPIYCQEIYPGDTVDMSMNCIVRMATPLHPVMDNCYLDVHWFFVPNRLVWDHWKNLMGESEDAWTSDIEYSVPSTVASVTQGSLEDYFGLPLGSNMFQTLPLRAYQLIWNEWYRDEALQDPVLINTGDAEPAFRDPLQLLPVNKYKDYFTSCLPQPQKGDPVTLALGSYAPVYTRDQITPVGDDGEVSLLWRKVENMNSDFAAALSAYFEASSDYGSTISVDGTSGPTTSQIDDTFSPANLWADLTGVSAIDVNSLRLAFAMQRVLETDARAGTRYREIVKAHFGVDVGDARVQVPEYLGGKHIPLNIMQVVQQSNTADQPSEIGFTGAFSKTFDADGYFSKSFVEHGFLIGLCSVRTDHTYSQGRQRFWNRRLRYDYYLPELAHIGEQPVMLSEIFKNGDNGGLLSTNVFGYQEAWADLRYSPNMTTSAMRPDAQDSYDVWHYGDDYTETPYLSDGWIRETDANLNRTLIVQNSDVQDQFIAQFYFDSDWTRPLPTFSIPGVGGRL